MIPFVLEIVLLVVLVVLFLLFAISLFYAIRFALLIIKIQDIFEECIEKLEERQQAIDKILQIPLFYDSPEVRKVLSEIRSAKETIIEAAQSIGRVEVDQEVIDDNR